MAMPVPLEPDWIAACAAMTERRKTRESPFRQAEPVEAWFLTAEGCGENAPAILFHPPFDKLRVTSRERYAGTGLDCRLRGNDGEEEDT